MNGLPMLFVRDGEEESDVASEWSWHDDCEVYNSKNSRSSLSFKVHFKTRG